MSEPAKRVENYHERDKEAPSYWKQNDTWYLHLPDSRDEEFDGLTANLANH